MLRRSIAALTCALSLALPSFSHALTIADITVPERISLNQHALVLNGAGLRKEFVFDVYVAALYTPTPTQDAALILDSARPQQIRLYLLRSVSHDQLMSSLKTGIQQNLSAQEQAEVKPGLHTFEKHLQKIGAVGKGDIITLSMFESQVTIDFNEQLVANIDDQQLGTALLQVWLGANPAQPSLKEALLGVQQ